MACSDYISSRYREGYVQCKTELGKKLIYSEKFVDFQKDMSTSMEELTKLIEQDYSSLKGQVATYLDNAKDKIITKAAAVLQGKLKEVNNSIEKLSSVKSFETVRDSQIEQAAILRKELESSPTADEVLFHKIYNCVNAFILEEKLARTSIQEAEDSRKQFKSRKFEMLSVIFQDYQLNQKEDLKKLQDMLTEFYDQTKKTEIKTIFKERLDKVFSKDIEAQQIDGKKAPEITNQHKQALVSPVKHMTPKEVQSNEALVLFTTKLCKELGTIIDSTRAQSLVSIPVVAGLLARELRKRKEAQLIIMERERLKAETQKSKEKPVNHATFKENLEALKRKKDPTIDLPTETDTHHMTEQPETLDSQGKLCSNNLIQVAKSLIIGKRHTDGINEDEAPLNPKIAEVDTLLSKLNRIQLSYTVEKKETKRLEKLSDLVSNRRDEKENSKNLMKTNPSKPTPSLPHLNLAAEIGINALHQRPNVAFGLYAQPKPQIVMRSESNNRVQDENYRAMKENMKINDRDFEWKQSQRGQQTQGAPKRHDTLHDPSTSLRESRKYNEDGEIEYQENGAMQVIQTLVLNSGGDQRRDTTNPRPYRTNLAKRPPQREGSHPDRPEELHFRHEERPNILRATRTNLPESHQNEKQFQISPDCKIIPYRLSRSDNSAMVHPNHSEFNLSKGNSFYFTGSAQSDYLEVLLHQENFVSSILVEPPKITHDSAQNLAQVNRAALYTLKNRQWEKLTYLDFKGQRQLVVPVNMRSSVFRISHGKYMDPNSNLGVGRLTLIG